MAIHVNLEAHKTVAYQRGVTHDTDCADKLWTGVPWFLGAVRVIDPPAVAAL